MAKVKDNLVTEGLSGKLGKRLVFRKGRGGSTILATRPSRTTARVYTEAQLAQQEALSQASVYARVARTQSIYIELAKGTEATAYNMAVADHIVKPQVLDIQANGWTGQPGQNLQVKAVDDTLVARVLITIHNGSGTVYEQGEAERSETDGLIWIYTTTSDLQNASPLQVEAVAYDLPGNQGASTIALN